MKRSIFTLCFLASAATAFAQLGEVSLSFGKADMRNKSLGTGVAVQGGPSVDWNEDASFRMAFRFTINSWRHFGHEIGYGYTRAKVNAGGTDLFNMSIHQGFYDFLAYATPEGSRIRPFAAGGVHFSTYFPPGASVFQGNGITKFGFNYGGGLKARVSDMFMVRFDVRDYVNGKPDFGLSPQGWFKMLEVSAGLAFMF